MSHWKYRGVPHGIYKILRRLGVDKATIEAAFHSSPAGSAFVNAHGVVFWAEWSNLRWYSAASVADRLRIGRQHSLNQFTRRTK